MSRILIVEDEKKIARFLELELTHEGYEVQTAGDGRSGLEQAQSWQPDLLILDLMLPELSGIEVCRRLRHDSDVPIIMLTAKDAEVDKITGLALGADDYIVKPFSAREVVARGKAVLRRYSMQETEPAKILHYGNLEININNYDVRLNGERLPLTPKEVEILQLLASHPGKVFSREKILSIVWGYEYYGDTRAVDTQIKRIRQKLPQEGVPWALKTVYGVGYRFEVNA